MARTENRTLRKQRSHSRDSKEIPARAGCARSFHLCFAGVLQGLLQGLLCKQSQPGPCYQTQPRDMACVQSSHQEPRWDSTLRSRNPLEMPEINFPYFYEGTDSGEDEELQRNQEGFKVIPKIKNVTME